jgi:phosphate transport system protein
MTTPHLEAALRRAVEGIRSKVIEMGALGERALQASLRAFLERNRQLAYAVILRDQYLDELETEIDRLCLEFIARQQPVATDLRFAFTAIKVNKELERIGDYAESVARQVLQLSTLEAPPPDRRFEELGNLAAHMLHDAVQAFLEQDADLARRTMAIEERANELRNGINAELARLNQAGQLATAALTPLMTIARRFERVTDQTKNICEEVLYLCTGEFIKHPGAEAFRILFVDEGNCCLSQMAEAIGIALDTPRFVFSSAGLAPVPLDPRLVEFLAGKGIDASRQVSKTPEQIPNAEHYQVLIALGDAAQKVFPAPPTKTVCLTWPATDPGTVLGSLEATRPAFESAYRSLDEHIRDLVAAIRGQPPETTTP